MRSSSGTKLAVIRRDRNMTQQQLADKSGVALSTIQLWETNGTMAAQVKKLAPVANALNVGIAEIIEIV